MILVTGATGRPGSAVIDELVARGENVRALVRDPQKARDLEAQPSVQVAQGDMLLPHTLGAALDGVDRVLMISSAGPEMLETQCTFIDAAVDAGVKHIVKFSGKDSVVGFDVSRFRSVRSHDQIERYLRASGLAWTVLLPSQFMQAYFEEIPAVVAHGELRLPLGSTTLAPIDTADIAKVAHQVLTSPGHEGQRYVMTGPEALTMFEIADCISNAVGSPVRYVDVDLDAKRQEWLDAGYPPARAEAFLQLFLERKRHGRSEVDLSTHERLGVRSTTFREFAAKHAAKFKGEAAYAVTPA